MLSTRAKLGWISVVLMVGSLIGYAWEHGGGPGFYAASLFKVGTITSLAWLAYPQLVELPRFATVTVAGIVVTGIVLSPGGLASVARSLVVVGPVLFLLFSISRRIGGSK
ncbi:MAG: hypothetical protein O3C60_15395 [Planctomycetota bacterium]|nr:hypothetical protein [Planctomycetota bacterium]